MFSATRSARLGLGVVGGRASSSCRLVLHSLARAAASSRFDALEFQVQFHLPRDLLLLAPPRRASAAISRFEPRAGCKRVAPGGSAFGESRRREASGDAGRLQARAACRSSPGRAHAAIVRGWRPSASAREKAGQRSIARAAVNGRRRRHRHRGRSCPPRPATSACGRRKGWRRRRLRGQQQHRIGNGAVDQLDRAASPWRRRAA